MKPAYPESSLQLDQAFYVHCQRLCLPGMYFNHKLNEYIGCESGISTVFEIPQIANLARKPGDLTT